MDKRYILGIHAGHNASAIIGDETGVLYAIQEERLTGEKNYWGFPEKAIASCLKRYNLTPGDVDSLVLGTQQVIFRYHSREDVLKSYSLQDTFVGKIRQRLVVPFVLNSNIRYGQKELIAEVEKIGFSKNQVKFYDHHLGHGATAYYGLRKSSDEDYLIVTCDGMGDNQCATVRVMGPNKNEVVAISHSDNSLGALYSWVTFRMGFVPLEHEYKLMGMAPYAGGSYAEEVKKIFYEFLDLDESGLCFKKQTGKRINDVSRDLFKRLDGKRFDSICGGLQLFTEEILSRWIQQAIKKTGVKKVLAAGGVFMNVKANKIIAEIPELEYFEAFPSCGDETLPIGAYYLRAAELLGAEKVSPLQHFYLGDELDHENIERLVNQNNLKIIARGNVEVEVAKILASNEPVARCVGGMEFGARALGNRSILADPKNQDVVRVINQMVKKRDFWMPFAPLMKMESSDRYIKNPKNLDSPYMMMTFDTHDNYPEMIAAVHNADLTCRAQLLREEQNPKMYKLLNEFEKLTGRSVILNTSYNLHGFPIAKNVEESLYVFMNSGLKYIQLDDYLIAK